MGSGAIFIVHHAGNIVRSDHVATVWVGIDWNGEGCRSREEGFDQRAVPRIEARLSCLLAAFTVSDKDQIDKL